MNVSPYPKRLIEVDLPIKRLSLHAAGEKSRDGHIASMHIWWARRPLAACRAVILALLWPDPADPFCPMPFIVTARRRMSEWARSYSAKASAESFPRLVALQKNPAGLDEPIELRNVLLDFIADFASWDNSIDRDYLRTARALTRAAHEALGFPGARPVIVDPFAGGGSIPLEALRVGADAVASDLNPVAVLLNKVVLEYSPRYGQRLADALRKWGAHIKQQAEHELSEFYPKDKDGATPITYLWARTIRCEGPRCGVEVPIMRSLWIDQARTPKYAVELNVGSPHKRLEPRVLKNPKPAQVKDGTSRRSSVTCPICHYTTPRKQVQQQAAERGLGQQLIAVALDSSVGRTYRAPTSDDVAAIKRASARLKKNGEPTAIPDEPLPYLRSIFNVHIYGIRSWGSLFSERQLLYLTTLVRIVRDIDLSRSDLDENGQLALRTALALVVDKSAMLSCTVARWRGDKGRLEGAFAMQALPMVWDWGELNPFNKALMPFENLVNSVAAVIETIAMSTGHQGTAQIASATSVPLPDDAASAVFTDPPYYDAIPYANLSDFLFVWLKRMLGQHYPELFGNKETPKSEEIVQLAERNPLYAHKTKAFFEEQMQLALEDVRRVMAINGIACVVFAHKTTAGWESLLNAILKAGWVITASWPIDTELTTRFKAIGTASLASSVHLVCRPRKKLTADEGVGEWRDVLTELPKRIHEWMPRLDKEGVAGADAIFACLGPALEVFSQYAKVEKTSGEVVGLSEYLEHVWAAVSSEALSMIFTEADAAGLEPDARITAMWLWTLAGGSSERDKPQNHESDEADEDDDDEDKRPGGAGFVLEYDAARKIAQGLGARLEALRTVVEVNGDKARLLPVIDRTAHLFGKDADAATAKPVKKKQLTLFTEETSVPHGAKQIAPPARGATTLDRIHQAMLLFGSGRGEALKRFVVDGGVGQQAQFWKLAQALSALYPSGSKEKRWVEGVLARKKSLGF